MEMRLTLWLPCMHRYDEGTNRTTLKAHTGMKMEIPHVDPIQSFDNHGKKEKKKYTIMDAVRAYL